MRLRLHDDGGGGHYYDRTKMLWCLYERSSRENDTLTHAAPFPVCVCEPENNDLCARDVRYYVSDSRARTPACSRVMRADNDARYANRTHAHTHTRTLAPLIHAVLYVWSTGKINTLMRACVFCKCRRMRRVRSHTDTDTGTGTDTRTHGHARTPHTHAANRFRVNGANDERRRRRRRRGYMRQICMQVCAGVKCRRRRRQ